MKEISALTVLILVLSFKMPSALGALKRTDQIPPNASNGLALHCLGEYLESLHEAIDYLSNEDPANLTPEKERDVALSLRASIFRCLGAMLDSLDFDESLLGSADEAGNADTSPAPLSLSEINQILKDIYGDRGANTAENLQPVEPVASAEASGAQAVKPQVKRLCQALYRQMVRSHNVYRYILSVLQLVEENVTAVWPIGTVPDRNVQEILNSLSENIENLQTAAKNRNEKTEAFLNCQYAWE